MCIKFHIFISVIFACFNKWLNNVNWTWIRIILATAHIYNTYAHSVVVFGFIRSYQYFLWINVTHLPESESESEIVYSIDMHRIHLQIKLHNTITHTHTHVNRS